MHHASLIFVLGTVHLAALCVGCTDSQGDRITFRQWWEGRGRSTPTESSETEPGPRGPSEEPPQGADRSEVARSNGSAEARGNPAIGVARRPPPANAVQSDGLAILGEFITVEDTLGPIRPAIEELAGTLPPKVYYQKAAELVRRQLLDEVAAHLIYNLARRRITEQMEPGVQKAVDRMERDRINREFQGLETEYVNYLEKNGKSRDEIRARLRRAVVVDSYLRETLIPLIPSPSKRELLSYYQSHGSDYAEPLRRELFMIDIMIRAFLDSETLRSRRRPSPEQMAEARKKARSAIEAAAKDLQGGKPFEEVARAYSEGVNKDNGGAWGFIRSPMAGRWDLPYRRFQELGEGETSEIIEAADSFFIVKVGRVEGGAVKSFQEAQPEIVRILKNRRFHKRRADFLQDQLQQSQATIGDLDSFVAQLMNAVPRPSASDAMNIAGNTTPGN